MFRLTLHSPLETIHSHVLFLFNQNPVLYREDFQTMLSVYGGSYYRHRLRIDVELIMYYSCLFKRELATHSHSFSSEMHFVPGHATIESSQCAFCLQELSIAVSDENEQLRIFVRRSHNNDLLVIHYNQIAYLRLTTEVLSLYDKKDSN